MNQNNEEENLEEDSFYKTDTRHVCVWDLTNHRCGSKLNFPYRPDGSNYGFDEIRPGILMEIPDRRRCQKVCPIHEIENLIDNAK